MSAENLITFRARVADDVELQKKILAIQHAADLEAAEKIAALSVEVGTPVSVEDLRVPQELSEDQLSEVAGGGSRVPDDSGFRYWRGGLIGF